LILVDTSVWIDHLHRSIAFLGDALESGDVLVHPFIIGELACGEMKGRHDFLTLLATLPASVIATDEETLHFIENRRLMGKGIGYIDAHLLASVTLTDGAQLWTRDSRLRVIAAKLAVGVEPP
jgi:hypothetical protein